ncbi:pentatricopeptide repeat-containing protein At1g02150 [Aristolochia californica]|uniref:pentatricopeptide repeat-containing protein At1g02150-like n=1 Tax=Aristolochia californica TaxID=171875 RepID=UPI0035D573AB
MAGLKIPIASSPTSNVLASRMQFATFISRPSPLSSTTSYSPTSGFCRPVVVLPSKKNKTNSIMCSISQVHSYGTVDYERRPPQPWRSLYRKITMEGSPSLGCSLILNLWEEEQGKIYKWTLCRIVRELRKFHCYKQALEVYEWMTERRERFRLNSSDIAIQLDLISKAHDVSATEEFFHKLPEASKDMRTYGALLNAYVRANMREKAETTLEKMKNAGFAMHALSCNVMMTLYMNLREYEKALSIVSEMIENDIRLDVYTYNIWITTCAELRNAEEMEQVLEKMKSDGNVIPNWTTFSTLASMYIKFGLFEKAEQCLKDLELRMTGRDRFPYHYLISLYSSIGKKEELYRIWNSYKTSFPRILNLGYFTMISSLVKVRDIEGAEAIYEEWLSVKSRYDPRIGNILLRWYIRQGLMEKAEKFLVQIKEIGGKPNQTTWELLAEGYISKDEITKALSCMQEASLVEGPLLWRPRPANVEALLNLCKEKSDPESMETLMELLKKLDCFHMDKYKALLRAHDGDNMDTLSSNLSVRHESDQSDESEKLLSQY